MISLSSTAAKAWRKVMRCSHELQRGVAGMGGSRQPELVDDNYTNTRSDGMLSGGRYR